MVYDFIMSIKLANASDEADAHAVTWLSCHYRHHHCYLGCGSGELRHRHHRRCHHVRFYCNVLGTDLISTHLLFGGDSLSPVRRRRLYCCR